MSVYNKFSSVANLCLECPGDRTSALLDPAVIGLIYIPLLIVCTCSPDVDIKYIGGADPEMVLLDKDYNEVKVNSCDLVQ